MGDILPWGRGAGAGIRGRPRRHVGHTPGSGGRRSRPERPTAHASRTLGVPARPGPSGDPVVPACSCIAVIVGSQSLPPSRRYSSKWCFFAKLQDDHDWLSRTFISCSESCLTNATFTTAASPLCAKPPFA